MKLTIKLKDGSQETAYLSDDTLKFLQNTIMDECDCEDIDSIDDWDYVDYAIMMNDELRIFKKKYNSEDVTSYEVDLDAQESEEEHKNRLLSYLAVYPDALSYAAAFLFVCCEKCF